MGYIGHGFDCRTLLPMQIAALIDEADPILFGKINEQLQKNNPTENIMSYSPLPSHNLIYYRPQEVIEYAIEISQKTIEQLIADMLNHIHDTNLEGDHGYVYYPSIRFAKDHISDPIQSASDLYNILTKHFTCITVSDIYDDVDYIDHDWFMA